MRIGIASGKGGTGKTTIATNLAKMLTEPVGYVDCDVEEPNGHIFLRPIINETIPVVVPVPRVDEARCTFSGACQAVCRFNAIAVLPNTVVVFDELCHGCGGCTIACPEEAIREEPREIGIIEKGRSGSVTFISGRLHVGEAMPPPLIRAVLRELDRQSLFVVDASPGTSCPVVTTLRDVDYCLLVTEPTPFGLNDLELAVEMMRAIGIPFGVVLNRDGIGNRSTDDFCARENIPVLARFPDDRRVAEAYARGEMVVDALPEYREHYIRLAGILTTELSNNLSKA